MNEYKKGGIGTGARSGQHGAPYSRAGAELRREANKVTDPEFQKIIKTVADRMVQTGKGINHR